MKDKTQINAALLQENLKFALSSVGKFVAGRSTLPVLANVLIESVDGRLKITGTNLEASMTVFVGAKIESEFKCTVPYKTLNDFVATLPPERVELSWVEKTATLQLNCARFNARIKGIEASEFPAIPHADETHASINPDEFKKAILRTVFAAATDIERPVLAGVLVSIEKSGRVTLTAADGFRLSIANLTAESVSLGKTKSLNGIVPSVYLSNVVKMFGDEEPVEISITGNGIQIASVNWKSHSTLIDGTYPDASKIIPASIENEFSLAVNNFADAVKMACVFARESQNRFNAKFSKNGNGAHVVVSAQSAESGDGTTDLDAQSDDKCDVALTLDFKYVADALNAMGSPSVKVHFNKNTNPVMLTPVGDESFKHVIMPMMGK